MKTTISNIGALHLTSKNRKTAYSCAKQNLHKALNFHQYITDREPLDLLKGLVSSFEYTSTRLTWDNENKTLNEIKGLS